MTILLTAKRLKHLVEYNPDTGAFIQKNRFHKSRDGTPCGFRDQQGYVRITIDGVSYSAHRVAWLYMTGEHPVATIDHKDMDRANNQWANLRAATISQNKANSRKRSDSGSPYKCVSWRPRQRKWMATVCCRGRRHYLGYFASPEAAHAAYLAASKKLHGEFARVA